MSNLNDFNQRLQQKGAKPEGLYERAEEFTRYFPAIKVMELETANVPSEAMRYFEEQSRGYSQPSEDYGPGYFEKFLSISHGDEESTIVAIQTKLIGVTHETERLAYFVDMLGKKKIGHGIMRNNLSNVSAYLANKPFSESIFADEEHRRKGHGKRLLRMMNAVAQTEYRLPLFSAMDTEGKGRRAWGELAALGEARLFKEGKYDRYVMESADTGRVKTI